jgi:hypothetical protein
MEEEMEDNLCIVCHGTKVYDKEICFRCEGKGTFKWPKRCHGECQTCKFPPQEPAFKMGDRFEVTWQGIGATGSRGIIKEVIYHPCSGNYYQGILDGTKDVTFGDSDGNAKKRGGNYIIKKINDQPRLNTFFGGA